MGKVSVGFRLDQVEVEMLDRIAAEESSNRTEIARRAIRNFDKVRQAEKTITTKAAEIYKTNLSNYDSHPIMVRIARQGIDVRDKAGNKVSKIENLKDLLDFVDKRVFNYGDNV